MPNDSVVDVTVVIPTFNRAKFISEAVDSVLNQSLRPARIIVVDDGSTDGTPQIMEKYAKYVEYVRKENGGKSLALNYVIPSVQTEYTWFFDDDDVAYPYAIKDLLGVIEKNGNLGFSFGHFDTGRSDAKLLSADVSPVPYPFSNEPIALQRLRLYRNYVITMSGSLIRTKALLSVGGLNSNLLRCQDYDLMVRLVSNFDFSYCASSVYIVREHEGVRGTIESQHAFHDRARIWAKYNEKIGQYLRYEMPLRLFSYREDGGDQVMARSALISRAWSLTPKLDLILSVRDLVEAFELQTTEPLNDFEVKILEETFNDGFVTLRSTHDLLHLWPLIFSSIGCSALGALAKGIYWQGLKEVRKISAMKLVGISVVLFGLSRIGKIFQLVRTSTKHLH